MGSLKIEINNNKAVLDGILDETADLSPLSGLAGDVTVNFKNVNRINSCGVKAWVDVLSSLDATLTYEDCTMVVVKQLNAVPDFQGKAKVSSLYAPYFCEECDEESSELLKVGDFDPAAAPSFNCKSCKKPIAFDGIANQYFSFIKR